MSSIDVDELVERKTQQSYPYIQVITPNDTLPLVVTDLIEGNIQLIVEFNGKRKVVARISESAYNINHLLNTVGKIAYYKSAEVVIYIDSIQKYLLECV